MKNRFERKMFAVAISSALAVSAFSMGTFAEDTTEAATEAAAAEESAEEVDAGLAALAGTYTDLMPVLREDDNKQYWYDALSQYCGIDDQTTADQVKDAFLSMYEADFYGNEAAALSATGYSTFDCYLEGVATFTVDGNTISGADENGNQIFSHTYKYQGQLKGDFGSMNAAYEQMYKDAGALDQWPVFSIYESEDETEDGFRYFAFGGDTPGETYHIEFRYGDYLNGLTEYYTGDYAYFMPSAILTDADEEMTNNCIDLFVSENAESISAIAESLGQ